MQLRQNLTDKASKSIDKFKSSTKEHFVSFNESTDASFMSKDHASLRAREKSQLREKLITKHMDKFVQRERPGVTSYYQKYVDSNVNNLTRPDSSRLKNNSYAIELRKQIEEKKNQSALEHEMNLRKDKELRDAQSESYRREQEWRSDQTKRNKEDLFKTNIRLMNDKHRREMKEKEWDHKRQAENLQANELILKEENRLRAIKKHNQQLSLQESFNTQLADKENKLKEERNSTRLETSTGFKFSCEHGNSVYPCSICSKMFPKKLLSRNIFH